MLQCDIKKNNTMREARLNIDRVHLKLTIIVAMFDAAISHHGRATPSGVRRAPQRAQWFRTGWSKQAPTHHLQQFVGELEQFFKQQRREIEDFDCADASNVGASQRSRQCEGRCCNFRASHVHNPLLRLGASAILCSSMFRTN